MNPTWQEDARLPLSHERFGWRWCCGGSRTALGAMPTTLPARTAPSWPTIKAACGRQRSALNTRLPTRGPCLLPLEVKALNGQIGTRADKATKKGVVVPILPILATGADQLLYRRRGEACRFLLLYHIPRHAIGAILLAITRLHCIYRGIVPVFTGWRHLGSSFPS